MKIDEIIKKLKNELHILSLPNHSRGKCVRYSVIVGKVLERFGYETKMMDLTVDGMNHTVTIIDDIIIDFTLSQFRKDLSFPYICQINTKNFNDVYEMDLPLERAIKKHDKLGLVEEAELLDLIKKISKKSSLNPVQMNPSVKKRIKKRIELESGIPNSIFFINSINTTVFINSIKHFRKDYYQFLTEMFILKEKVRSFSEKFIEDLESKFDKSEASVLIRSIDERIRISHGQSFEVLQYKSAMRRLASAIDFNFPLGVTYELLYFDQEDFLKHIPNIMLSVDENELADFLSDYKEKALKAFPILADFKKIYFEIVERSPFQSLIYPLDFLDELNHYNSMFSFPLIKNYVLTVDKPLEYHILKLKELENESYRNQAKKIYLEAKEELAKELRRSPPRYHLIKEHEEAVEIYDHIIQDNDGEMTDITSYIQKFSGGIPKENLTWGKTLITYNNGYLWESLGVAACSLEADAMGHCGNEPRKNSNDKMFSFRKKLKDGTYKVSMTVTVNKGFVMEWKAYGNSKPSEKFHPFIVDLLLDKEAKIENASGNIGYESENNFHFDELEDELKDKVLEMKPFINDEIEYAKKHKLINFNLLESELKQIATVTKKGWIYDVHFKDEDDFVKFIYYITPPNSGNNKQIVLDYTRFDNGDLLDLFPEHEIDNHEMISKIDDFLEQKTTVKVKKSVIDKVKELKQKLLISNDIDNLSYSFKDLYYIFHHSIERGYKTTFEKEYLESFKSYIFKNIEKSSSNMIKIISKSRPFTHIKINLNNYDLNDNFMFYVRENLPDSKINISLSIIHNDFNESPEYSPETLSKFDYETFYKILGKELLEYQKERGL
mgnify:CR=1 FL=1